MNTLYLPYDSETSEQTPHIQGGACVCTCENVYVCTCVFVSLPICLKGQGTTDITTKRAITFWMQKLFQICFSFCDLQREL